eukprot:IDg94t1
MKIVGGNIGRNSSENNTENLYSHADLLPELQDLEPSALKWAAATDAEARTFGTERRNKTLTIFDSDELLILGTRLR